MSTYKIGDMTVNAEDQNIQQILTDAYQSKKRPFCVCLPQGIEMYIAKVENRYIVKRMPNSGGRHSPDCESYEPPAELSGLGEVLGNAIQENPEDGQTILKFDFSLSKRPGKAAPIPSGVEKDSVKSDGKKLTLRGTLHYLFEEAGFNRWTPSMNGKRNWYNIRKFLLNAAGGKEAKKQSLIDILYIPEMFNLDQKADIEARRRSKLAPLMNQKQGLKQLMIVIGEIKEIGEARYGHKIIFKHLPDFHFLLDKDIYKRINKRFSRELELWNGIEDSHLICIATFGITTSGFAAIEELSLMNVNNQWIPFENLYEIRLIEEMISAKRKFIKGLRYNLPSDQPLASLIAADTLPKPTAMYIIPPSESDEYETSILNLIAESDLQSWNWNTEVAMPELPAIITTDLEKGERANG
jgi:hypothetical protein